MKIVSINQNPQLQALSEAFEQLNPEKKPLTVDVLKTFKNSENYTEEQAKLIIETLEKFATVLYEIVTVSKINVIDNQHVIYLNNQNKSESHKENLNQLKAA